MDNISKAIENIQKQYKEIGVDYSKGEDMTAITLLGSHAEMVIKALDKQILREPIMIGEEIICPACKGGMLYPPDVTDDTHQHCNYCNECGQRLDWSKYE